MNKLSLLFLTLVLSLNFSASAEETSATLSMNTDPAPKTGFRTLVDLTAQSNLYKAGSRDREAGTELLLKPSYQLDRFHSLSAKAIVFKEETGGRETTLSDVLLGIKRATSLVEGEWRHSYGLSGIVPANRDSKNRDRLQGGFVASYSLSSNWKDLETTYGVAVTRNFHDFTVNADGDPNTEYGIKQSLGTSWEFANKWSFEITGIYNTGWTYRDYQRNSFGFSTSLNYQATKAWALFAGLSTEGNALKSSGTGSNIKAYDDNTSVIQAGVEFVN